MYQRIKISKKLALRLVLFMGLIGSAMLFDFYHDEIPAEVSEANENRETTEHGTVYLINQTAPVTAKTQAQRNTGRKLLETSHARFLQKYHGTLDNRALKSDEKMPKSPLFLTCHYLAFRNHNFTLPDDDPPLA